MKLCVSVEISYDKNPEFDLFVTAYLQFGNK